MPDTPALSEVGLKGVGYSVWSALYAPAGTPALIVERLRKAFETELADADVRKRIASFGLIVRTGFGDEFMRKVRDEGTLMAETIKRLGGPPPQ
jgi:tripartite-type tricarboxylate transporter receptor subunit TctC